MPSYIFSRYGAQQRVEGVFSFSNFSGNINVLEGVLEPIGLPQIGCPPRGERVYHRAASQLPLRANVVGHTFYLIEFTFRAAILQTKKVIRIVV